MSWLDLDADEGPTHSLVSSSPAGKDGLVPCLLGLVGGGIVGLWTEYGLDLWKPVEPAALAAVLGMEEVERRDIGGAYAEVGHMDTARNALVVRQRTPGSGHPRRFAVQPGAFPDEKLDPWSIWQLKRMADLAVRRGSRFVLQPGGYGSAELTIGFQVGEYDKQRRIIVTATPAWVAKSWEHGRLGAARGALREPSRSTAFPVTPAGVDQAVAAIVAAVKDSGLRTYEMMPAYPTP